ncbi:phage portal protein [Cellulophaga phage phi46:1]|uniref:portal protein n=1 Tax=Cellulophaga phage phi46:1 TaxID=1327974 RepID=UPI0003516F39|nr:portal protein [Cellulophaga phage phi46:1]AGO47818.1 phage portal protein [Cellulophaga phage phi46:1]
MKTYNIDAASNSVLFPKLDKRTEVVKWSYNGQDNQLPSIIEHLALESVTTRACLKKLIPAIYGNGFEGGNIKINAKGQTLNSIGRNLSHSLALHGNAFVHARFNGEKIVGSIEPKSCSRVRLGADDDSDYSGKFCLSDWAAKRITASDIVRIDKLNLNSKVLDYQIKAIGGLTRYMGQIDHLTTDESLKYAPSPLFPALEYAEAEKMSKTFTRNNSQFGFMNSKALIVGSLSEGEEYSLKKDLKNMQGVENTSNLMVFQATNPTADLDKQMILKDLTANPSDKILAYSDEKSEAAICKAFSVPVALVSSKSEGIFGNSGELMREMKRQLYEDMEFERQLIEETLSKIIEKSVFRDKIQKVKFIDVWQQAQ